MCNFLHEPVTKIKEEGAAYKLFTKVDKDYYPLCKYGYKLSTGDSLIWDDKKAEESILYEGGGDGFCMMMSKQGALKALNAFDPDCVYGDCICKIKYRGGLGKFREKKFTSKTTTIALCKEFQIIEEVAE